MNTSESPKWYYIHASDFDTAFRRCNEMLNKPFRHGDHRAMMIGWNIESQEDSFVAKAMVVELEGSEPAVDFVPSESWRIKFEREAPPPQRWVDSIMREPLVVAAIAATNAEKIRKILAKAEAK